MTTNKTNQFGLLYDPKLLFPAIFLVGIGIVMVYSASSAIALKKFGNDYFFLKRQVMFAMGGLVVLIVCRHLPYRFLRPLAYVILTVTVLFLLIVSFSSLGHSAGGAKRWIRLQWFSFQPAEMARFAMVLYLAYSLSKKQDRIKEFSIGFLPHVVVLGILATLILCQPDFGTVIILALITWLMMFTGGVRLSHLTLTLMPAVPIVLYFIFSAEYRLKRILSFINPWQYPANEGYQIVHSFMAFGSGGLWGKGIGQSYQKLFYLPEPHTDFIFSVIGEELGLWGVFLVLGLYLLIFLRGIQIARNAKDPFGALLAFGLTIAIGLQVCINMCVTLGLLPTKGLTLPFLSYGGTSLLFNMAFIGILMNIGETSTK